MRLIKLTQGNGDPFYLNADKILTVHPTRAGGSTIHHEPYNQENVADWVTVQEPPDVIARIAFYGAI